MAQLFVVTRYGNGWANMPKYMDGTCRPCLTLDPGKPEGLEYRLRPTGESGSGPYFHSYVKPDNGINRAWCYSKGSYLSDRMDYHEVIQDDSIGSWYPFRELRTYCNGEYYYEYYYQSSFDSGPWRWKEQYGVQVFRWNGPVDSSSTALYPKALVLSKSGGDKLVYDRGIGPCRNMQETYWAWAQEIIQSVVSADIEEDGSIIEVCNMARAYDLFLTKAKIDNFGFKYGEATCFEWYRITGELPPMFQSLANAAYVEACDSLPEAGCNSIATVLEIAEGVSDLIRGKAKGVKNLKDVWLNYRYVITTNKMDIAEYCDVTQRLCNLASQEKVTVHGQANYGDIVCSCSIDVRLDNVLPKDQRDWLTTYGFKLSAVNMWDMVPYSFVVDWFFRVGEILETIEKMGKALEVPVENCWFSFRSKYGNQDTFLRVPGGYKAAFPYVSYRKTSSKTVFKRILDAICLFT